MTAGLRRVICLKADSKVEHEIGESFEEDLWKTIDMGDRIRRILFPPMRKNGFRLRSPEFTLSC